MIANYYGDYWLNADSVFNIHYQQKRDYSADGISKLTFVEDDKFLSKKLLLALERINNSRVGYYDRHQGERTIFIQ